MNKMNDFKSKVVLATVALGLHVKKVSANPSVDISLFLILVLKIRSAFVIKFYCHS